MLVLIGPDWTRGCEFWEPLLHDIRPYPVGQKQAVAVASLNDEMWKQYCGIYLYAALCHILQDLLQILSAASSGNVPIPSSHLLISG